MSILEKLKNNLSSRVSTKKIIEIPKQQTRIKCLDESHKDPLGRPLKVIITFTNMNDLETICECGTIYRRV